MEDKIYKICSSEPGVSKMELVKMLYDNGKMIQVQSIFDSYRYAYNRGYFINNAEVATESDIQNYKFECN